uniref:Uncharacterized protein n=1 Tax=Psilocybe cubensis TaxID=181762 RepID=A0A8H8CM53_PSICU
MSEDSSPPAYSTSGAKGTAANSFPPSYTPPSTYVIGSTTTTGPLVGLQEVKGHLLLLNIFANLKSTVEKKEFILPNVPHEKDRKWAWFVGLSVERFDIWCRSINPKDASAAQLSAIPPIDVIMVWHSYMLNPRWYTEDCMRIPACKNLKTLEPLFNELLLNSSILTEPPSKARIEFWERQSNLGFDLLNDVGKMSEKTISCPACDKRISIRNDGSGYLQQKFSVFCLKPGCPMGEITKERMALAKLAQDLSMTSTGNPEDSLA